MKQNADEMSKLRNLAVFTRTWGTLLENGTPILEALHVAANEAPSPFPEAAESIEAAIRQKRWLREALAERTDVFPSYYRIIVGQGEVLGSTDQMVKYAADPLVYLARGMERGLRHDDAVLDQSIALLLFTRQLAELLRMGIWWGRGLRILESEAPAPFDEVAKQLQLVPADRTVWYPFSERLGKFPQFFSPFYRLSMVKMGEVYGSVTDEAMTHLSSLLEEDWKLSRLVGWETGRASLIIDLGQPTAQDWSGLTEPQRKLTLLLLCRAVSMVISLGTPLAKAFEVAAYLLPITQQKALLSAAASFSNPAEGASQMLKQLGFIPGFLITMLRAGELADRIDYHLNQAAEVYRFELESV